MEIINNEDGIFNIFVLVRNLFFLLFVGVLVY